MLQDTVPGWGHCGYPEVPQTCCPACSQLSPRAVPAGSGLTHISWEWLFVANAAALLPAGCKQELFLPARGWGSPASCSKALHGMQLSPSYCGPGSTDVLTPFGDSQCLAGSPASPRSCVRGWQSPPGGAALGLSSSAPQHRSCSVAQATASRLSDRWDIPVCHWGCRAHQDFADNVCCAGSVGDPLCITSTSVITRQG